LEGHARIDATQDADQAAADTVAGGDFTGDVFLAVLSRVQVADLAALLPGLAERSLFQAGGHLQAVGREILIGNAVDPQVVLEAAAVGQVAQSAAEEEPVKATENAADQRGEPGEKGVHDAAAQTR